MIVPRNPNAPHKVVLWVQAEVHEVLPTGDLSGNVAHNVERFALAIHGDTRDEAVLKLNNLLGELKSQCRPL